MRQYPQAPGWKEGSTSRDAAKIIEPTVSAAQAEVLQILKTHSRGLTADQIADLMARSVLYVRPRVSELHTLGLIQRAERRGVNRSGIPAAVWIISNVTVVEE